MAYPVQSLPDGRVRMSDGSIQGPQSTNQGVISTYSSGPMANTYPAPQQTTAPQQPTGDVLGTSTDIPADNSGNDTFAEMQRLAQEQARLELESALSSYDKYAEEATAQKTSLGTQKASTLSEMEAGLAKSEKAHITAEEEATEATTRAKGRALSAAEDIKRKNRNVLRALGILSSSAAGEMLSKPMTEYGRQRGELEQGLLKRLGTVEDWWLERQGEFTRAKNNLEQQYTELMGNIDRDLRFNERDRITAVKAAQNALQMRIQEIQAAAMGYQQQAQQYSNDILKQIAEIKLYQNPQADMSGILSSMIQPSQPKSQPQQVGTLLSDEEKKKYGLLSGFNV